MSKRLYKIIEIIGVLIIFLIIYRLFPFVNIILKYIFKIIMPFLIAFSIAFIFEPFIVFLEKKKINRKIAIGFIVGLFKYLKNIIKIKATMDTGGKSWT